MTDWPGWESIERCGQCEAEIEDVAIECDRCGRSFCKHCCNLYSARGYGAACDECRKQIEQGIALCGCGPLSGCEELRTIDEARLSLHRAGRWHEVESLSRKRRQHCSLADRMMQCDGYFDMERTA